MEGYKIVALVIGATGFWKLLEIFVKVFSERKLKTAEVWNLQTQAEKTIMENWMQWSQTLEKRVKESDEHTRILEEIIDTLHKQVKELKNLCLNTNSAII